MLSFDVQGEPTYAERKAATKAALMDPRVGDRFHEMYSFWLYVVAVTDAMVVTMEGSPPVTFPDGAKMTTQTRAEFLNRMLYRHGGDPWVLLADRGNDVAGWIDDLTERR